MQGSLGQKGPIIEEGEWGRPQNSCQNKEPPSRGRRRARYGDIHPSPLTMTEHEKQGLGNLGSRPRRQRWFGGGKKPGATLGAQILDPSVPHLGFVSSTDTTCSQISASRTYPTQLGVGGGQRPTQPSSKSDFCCKCWAHRRGAHIDLGGRVEGKGGGNTGGREASDGTGWPQVGQKAVVPFLRSPPSRGRATPRLRRRLQGSLRRRPHWRTCLRRGALCLKRMPVDVAHTTGSPTGSRIAWRAGVPGRKSQEQMLQPTQDKGRQKRDTRMWRIRRNPRRCRPSVTRKPLRIEEKSRRNPGSLLGSVAGKALRIEGASFQGGATVMCMRSCTSQGPLRMPSRPRYRSAPPYPTGAIRKSPRGHQRGTVAC